MLPALTPRLRLREMTPQALEDMAALLSDSEVMRHYPALKSRQEAMSFSGQAS